MANTDQHIKDILSKKLSNHESAVRPDLWADIEAHLPSAVSTATTTGAKGLSILSKVLIGVAAAALVITTALIITNEESGSASVKTDPVLDQSKQEEPENNAGESSVNSSNSPLETSASETNHSHHTTLYTEPNALSDEEYYDELKDTDTYYTGQSNTSEQNTEKDPALHSSSPTENGGELENEPVITTEFSAIEVDRNQQKWFFFSAQDNAVSYTWKIDGELKGQNNNLSFVFEEAGEHEVTLIINSELTKSKTVNVLFPSYLKPVNSFSPNGDMKNDEFDVLEGSLNIERVLSFTVFDQVGNILFESSSDSVWNGFDRFGNVCVPGSYLYSVVVLDINGEKVNKAGSIQLFKN